MDIDDKVDFIRNLDLYTALLVSISSLVAICVNYIFLGKELIWEIAITLLIFGSIYVLLIRRYNFPFKLILYNIGHSSKLLLSILFYALIAVINFLFHITVYRPQVYFILLICCTVLIAFDIIILDKNVDVFKILLKIFVVVLIIHLGLYYEYPGYYGVDPWSHMFCVLIYQDVGYLSVGPLINYPPLFHIEVLSSLLLTGLNLKDSLFLSIGIMYCIGVVFLFLFANRLFDVKIALLSSLLLSINQFHIVWGAWLVPTSVGVIVLPLMLYYIHKSIHKKCCRISFILLVTLLSMASIFYHTLSPLVICLIISIFILCSFFYSKLLSDSRPLVDYSLGVFTVCLLFLLTLSRYIYLPYSGTRNFLEWVLYPLVNTISTISEFSGGEFSTHSIAVDYPLNRVAFLLFVGFTLVGVLLSLSRGMRTQERVGLICALVGIMLVAYGPALINIGNFVPGRWLVFGVLIAAPFTALGIIQIASFPKVNVNKVITLFVLIALISFFSLNNSGVNPRTPFYGEFEDPHSYAYTHSELCAADTVTTISIGMGLKGAYAPFSHYRLQKFGTDVAIYPERYRDVDVNLTITRAYDLSRLTEPKERDDKLNEYERNNVVYTNRDVWVTFGSM